MDVSANKHFDVGESICYFITQKSNNNIITEVIHDNVKHHIDLNNTIELILTKEDKLWKSINSKVVDNNFPKLFGKRMFMTIRINLLRRG